MAMQIKKRLLSLSLCLLFAVSMLFSAAPVSAASELISLNKPVTASSTAGGMSAPSALTMSANCLWASDWSCVGQQYVTIDLQGFYTIDKIGIVGAPGNINSRTYFRVMAAFDTVNGWTEIVPQPSEPHPESTLKEYTVTDGGTYRYVRLERTNYTQTDTADNCFVLSNVSVYGTSLGVEDVSTGQAEVTASSSANPGSEANLASGTGSYWESSYTSSSKEYFTFDLQDFCQVTHVAVNGMFGSGNYESRMNFKILGSADASFSNPVELVPEETEDIGESKVKTYTVGSEANKQYIRYVRLAYQGAGYRASTGMTVYGKRAPFSALNLGCSASSLVGGETVSLSSVVKNNSGDSASVSALMVLSRAGRVIDLAYVSEDVADKGKVSLTPFLVLPQDVTDYSLNAYVFTDWNELRLLGSLSEVLTTETVGDAVKTTGTTTNLSFDYSKQTMKVSLFAGKSHAGENYFSVVLMPDADGAEQTLSASETEESLKTKLFAVSAGKLDTKAEAAFSVPVQNGGAYRAISSVNTLEKTKLLTEVKGSYLDGEAQRQIAAEIQEEPKASLESKLAQYCKGSSNEILPEIDLTNAVYTAHKDEVQDLFIALRDNEAMTDIGDVSQNFLYALTLTDLKYNEITAASLDELIAVFALNKTHFTEDMRSAVVKSMNLAKAAKAFSEAKDLVKAFDTAVFLEAVNAAECSDISELVEDYEYLLSVSYGDYDETQVNKALTDCGFESIEEFEEAFEARKKEIDEDKPKSSRPVGNGGGGGGKVSFETAPVVPSQEVNEDNSGEKAFSDIAHVSWAHEAIAFLTERGVSGKGNGVFAPDDVLKREEGAKMLLAALEVSAEKGTEAFADAQTDAWYVPYLATVSRMGYFRGDEYGNFGIGQGLSREDFAVVLYRVLQNEGGEIPSGEEISFADEESISAYAASAVKQLAACGIIGGMENGEFAPKQSVTRAQAAKMLYGTIQFMEKGGANA